MALALLAGVTATAEAAPAPDRVSFCGRVLAEPHHCLIVRPLQVGKPNYDISRTSPAPPVGKLIGGTGAPRKTSVCNEKYVALSDVKWKLVDVCALAKP
jgi:hypothetical protein